MSWSAGLGRVILSPRFSGNGIRIFWLDETPLQYSPLFQEKPRTIFLAEVRHLGSGEIEPQVKGVRAHHALYGNSNKKRSAYCSLSRYLNILSLYGFSKHRFKSRGTGEKQRAIIGGATKYCY